MQPFTVGFSHGANPTGNQAKDNGFRLEYTQVDYLVKMAMMMTTMMTMMMTMMLPSRPMAIALDSNTLMMPMILISNIYSEWSHLIVRTFFVERLNSVQNLLLPNTFFREVVK